MIPTGNRRGRWVGSKVRSLGRIKIQIVGSDEKSDPRMNMNWRAFGLLASKTSGYEISNGPDPTILTRPEDISVKH